MSVTVRAGAAARHHWRLAVEVVLLAAAVGTVALLNAIGSRSPPGPAVAVPPGPLPPPPPGAFVIAHEDGALGVAIAVRSSGSRLALTGTVLDQNGLGVSGLHVTFEIPAGGTQRAFTATACGSGCYSAAAGFAGRPASVGVDLEGPGRQRSSVVFAMPTDWPPVPAASTVRRAASTIEQLHSLVTHERLASDPAHVAITTYVAVAPNRLHYTVENDEESIIIGPRRWDRSIGGPWQESPQEPIRVPSPAWGPKSRVTNAYRLGTTRIRGTTVWEISFATPQQPAWFTIWVDPRTGRTLELRMTAAAHFMHHTYGPFNKPIRIEPP